MLIVISHSCSDGLPDEQFEKLVLLTKNGWTEQEVDVSKANAGVVEIPIVASISGTSTNGENLTVTIDFDADTLDAYNFEKYRAQTDLYYHMIPSAAVSFESTTIDILKDEDKGLTVLKLDLSKITEKYDDYVIPIQITNTSKYALGENTHTKVLYHLSLKNSYSGTYSGNLAVYKTKGSAEINDETQKITIASKSLYALTDSVCYFYAGQVDRSDVDRDKYVVNMKVINDSTVTFQSDNADLDVVLESASVTYAEQENTSDQRYVNLTTTFDLTYKFTDIEGNRLRTQGMMSMMQTVLK